MTALERLERWHRVGLLSDAEYRAIAPIVRKDRFSVFLELNALLYLGVLAIAAGLAWTIQTSFADLGDAAIILGLSALLAGCFYYCFSRGLPYSPERVESPRLAFDYVLYLGCLIFAIELAYFEIRFHILREIWDYHVLLSAVVFFGLAYRFDNRFVLSLALSTLAAWFGIRLSGLGWDSPELLRPSALVYSGLVAAAGMTLHQYDIKKHFLETYLHVSVNAAFLALLNGTLDERWGGLYLLGMLALAAVVVWLANRHRRFPFVAYGVTYAYLGITAKVIDHLGGPTITFAYFVISGIAVLVFLISLARAFGRDE
jgi:hypothetical protein